jgi:hypothetical protein
MSTAITWDYLHGIFKSSSLADSSKGAYEHRLHMLRGHIREAGCDRPANWVLGHPDEVMSVIAHLAPETKRAFASLIASCFSHDKYLAETRKADRALWSAVLSPLAKTCKNKYLDNVVSDKQKAAFVSWNDVLAGRDSLPENTPERLLLEMYTRVPPKRNDYSHVRIYKDTSAKTRTVTTDEGNTVRRGTFMPTEAQKKEYPNYMILDEPAGDAGSNVTLYMHSYKTSRPGQTYVQHLPAGLCAVIRSSLEKTPRGLLFVIKRSGIAFKDESTFGDWANRTLQNVFPGKKVTVNTLRHSFISSLKLDSMTARELGNTAKHLQHSLQTLMTYRFDVEAMKSLTCKT